MWGCRGLYKFMGYLKYMKICGGGPAAVSGSKIMKRIYKKEKTVDCKM